MTTQEVYDLPIGALLRIPDGTFLLLLDRFYPEVIEDIAQMSSIPEYEIQELGMWRVWNFDPIFTYYTDYFEDAKRIA
jgi:hypothetical protein